MGIKNFLLMGLFLVFMGCQPMVEDLVIDSFEDTLNSKTVDFGAGEGSSVRVSASKEFKQCGEQSLKVEYNLRPSSYMWIARGYGLDVKGAAHWEVEPQEIAWKRYNAISVSMYGRNSGAVVAFDIKDAKGELWRFLLDDDFAGWKEISCLFKNFFVRSDWQPETAERNEILDFPIMSFQFEPRLPGRGVYYFDCIKLRRVKK
ncbi:MAG: hypothetical protein JSW17_04535 [Candidatus Omnitrophota bacterium]|nr:MAG: hypothetical protein JSW17_04535 [Candidatus Omnitrophota bacterium]